MDEDGRIWDEIWNHLRGHQKHALDLIKKSLSAAGIPVETDSFYVKSKPNQTQLAEAGRFAEKYL